MEEELKRLRYNINDLLEQLRLKNVPDITDVEYAILETSGQLSVILKSEKRPVEPKDLSVLPPYEGMPVTLIIDGRVIDDNLGKIKQDMDWLKGQLKKSKVTKIEEVLFASLDMQGNFYCQVKSSRKKSNS